MVVVAVLYLSNAIARDEDSSWCSIVSIVLWCVIRASKHILYSKTPVLVTMDNDKHTVDCSQRINRDIDTAASNEC